MEGRARRYAILLAVAAAALLYASSLLGGSEPPPDLASAAEAAALYVRRVSGWLTGIPAGVPVEPPGVGEGSEVVRSLDALAGVYAEAGAFKLLDIVESYRAGVVAARVLAGNASRVEAAVDAARAALHRLASCDIKGFRESVEVNATVINGGIEVLDYASLIAASVDYDSLLTPIHRSIYRGFTLLASRLGDALRATLRLASLDDDKLLAVCRGGGLPAGLEAASILEPSLSASAAGKAHGRHVEPGAGAGYRQPESDD